MNLKCYRCGEWDAERQGCGCSDRQTIFLGDNREILPLLPFAFATSTVTDPPYGLSFMGRGWDKGVPGEQFWQLISDACKPGAMCLAFGGTRTFHRLACAIEDAAWEVRDTLMWLYGSGFPKSLDVSKAIDKASGAERPVVGAIRKSVASMGQGEGNFSDDNYKWKSEFPVTAPATNAAKQWNGWGTALKPAWEPIILARKPLAGTVAENVLQHGAGALNIEGCRIGTSDHLGGGSYGSTTRNVDEFFPGKKPAGAGEFVQPTGRWPANVIHDGSDEVVRLFPESDGQQGDVRGTEPSKTGGEGTNCYGEYDRIPADKRGDSGSAARFFYTAKASKSDRGKFNNHPTVKPTDLMRYLCRLVTPIGGIVLDPFMGSGSTLVASKLEFCKSVGIELDERYCEIAARRLEQEAVTLPGF